MSLKLIFIRSLGVGLLALAAAAPPAAAQASGGGPAAPDSLPTYASADGRVYLTRDEALREVFPDLRTVRAERWTLSKEEARRIRDGSGVEVPSRRPILYRVRGEGEELLGWGMILEERGKYRPITMMVGIAPDFSVRGVEVMVYREDRGEEVRHDRFLGQYRDKDAGDPIRTHRDIMNITGATISVHSVNDGVRRALHTVGLLYGGDERPPPGGTAAGEAGDDGGVEPTVLARWRPGVSR